MQLVVMVAVLVLALSLVGEGVGADPRCGSGCHPTNISIPVESCGAKEHVFTTICEGQCYHEELNYESHEEDIGQKTCNGDWSYEVKYFSGCPVGVTYPVARNCRCARCDDEDTYCGHFPGDIPSCPFF